MLFLLKLKHWQIFFLTWGVIIAFYIVAFPKTDLLLGLLPVATVILATGTFCWVYAIATVLHDKLPMGVHLNMKRFKILFVIPIFYTLALILGLGYLLDENRIDNPYVVIAVGLIVLIHLFSIGCIIYGIRFAAKTMKSIELGRLAKFGDYVGEFFLIWFSILGFWILQPKLNKMVKGL